MSDVLADLRRSCALVAERAGHVQIMHEAIEQYAAGLDHVLDRPDPDPALHITSGTPEELAAFWITLDAINFGSGWFPTLRKRAGRSGYFTIAIGLRDRFVRDGRWRAEELSQMTPEVLAAVLDQDPSHELMGLFACSLRDLGQRLGEYGGSFTALVRSAQGSAPSLVERLAGWRSFRDASTYDGLEVPFLKRAQIAAADLHRAGVARLRDVDQLTMFADNLVPHVLRLDGVLVFDPDLVDRIESAQLIEHGSAEEVEIRACALHAVELLSAHLPQMVPADIDELLWRRGQEARYKARPRHRSRCTAY